MDILWIIFGIIIGGIFTMLFLKSKESSKIILEEKKLLDIKNQVLEQDTIFKNREIERKTLFNQAKDESRSIIEKAKAEASELKINLEKEKTRIETHEKTLEKQEKQLDSKVSSLENQKNQLTKKEEELAVELKKLKESNNKQKEALASIANLSEEEAKNLLLEQVEKDVKDVLLKQMEKTESDLKKDAEKNAQKIICQAIQRFASEVASENTTTLIELPSDEIKGRIIGREGRNINTIEKVTGVDIIVDDTPGSIMISGYDLVRRYTAKKLIEKLIEDGRIHPARIEELVTKAQEDTNKIIQEFGEKTLMEMGISNVHPDLAKILGRLRFRTSYGQNQLKHAKEVAYLCMAMANELGIDPEKAKIAGIFHDIGKAVDHEIEGGHAMIGYEILKKYKIDDEIAYAVGSHHEDMPINTPLGFIVCAGDAISGARPGARKESIENYIKRLQELEGIANSFKGVRQSYAMQAGREIRVLVDPSDLDDYESKKLALDVTKKIEKDLTYPGQIKVHVIRETREIEFAK